MNRFFRFIIAAWGAKKLGGGCLSTIVIFIIINMLLGKCSNDNPHAAVPARHVQTAAKAKPVPLCGYKR
jgi:uncharacterized membrane protein